MWRFVYKVLKWKTEIDLAFFLTLILFSLVTIGKEILRNPEFLTAWIKEVLVMKIFYSMKNHFEILDLLSESNFALLFLKLQ